MCFSRVAAAFSPCKPAYSRGTRTQAVDTARAGLCTIESNQPHSTANAGLPEAAEANLQRGTAVRVDPHRAGLKPPRDVRDMRRIPTPNRGAQAPKRLVFARVSASSTSVNVSKGSKGPNCSSSTSGVPSATPAMTAGAMK